jgi:hypothetical protein
MRKITDFAPSQQILDTFLDQLQDEQHGAIKADSNNDVSQMEPGIDERIWQYATGLATATLVKIDGSIDWRDRFVSMELFATTDATQLAGGANDHNLNVAASWGKTDGYTGTGGLDAGGSAPTNGNPPVSAAGKFMQTPLANEFVYAHPSSGVLYIYNNTGSTQYYVLKYRATGDTGKR